MKDTKQRLLDAAGRIVVRDGGEHLTLAAVASEAGVSKGGLLHHFGSKQALIEGMVDRLIGQFDAALAEADDTAGAATRAYLRGSVTGGGIQAERTTAVLLAAVLVEPAALEPLRASYQRWQERLSNDGISPTTATMIRLAADGWWLADLLDLAPPAGELRDQTLADLIALTEEGNVR